jgi:predicted dehydrogenase
MTLPFLDAVTPLQIGILGCGWFGRVHVERLSEIHHVTVSAVCDPDKEAAQRLADRVPEHLRDPQSGVAVYTDYRELLRHPRLHAVSVNSPNRWHVEQLLAALEQGLHVLCEKPLTLIPDEVTQVVEATAQARKLVAIAYQSRYRRDARVLQSALRSGKWGAITFVSIYAQEDWLTPNVGTWRHDPARCHGGYFGDANGHQLDFLFWATGLEAAWVRATMETRGTPVPMVTWGEASLRTQAGIGSTIPMTFSFVGTAHHWREEICITTERADFVMRNGQLLWSTGNAPLGPLPESEILPETASLPTLPDSAFVAALRGGPPILSPPETVWPVLRFTLAALASAENGGTPHNT